MTRQVLGRREVLMGAGVAAGGVALAGLAAAPAAADDDEHELSGSWLVTRHDNPPSDTTPVKVVVSFADGDVFIAHDIKPAAPPFTGTWAKRRRGFTATMWTGFSGPNGAPGPTAQVRLRGTVSQGSLSGTYDFAVFDPKTDSMIDHGSGSFTGTPIEA